ncbi:MAG TPA: Ada metal-binding domain-containing protein [Cellulomonadaceae bacterium]|nr:Ada metal-binding domain-containing protein [Cellulomonadaceae bacterium]
MTLSSPVDAVTAYRAISSRDPRYDGRLYVGVVSTGIYCRPSCPARTPRPENCTYFTAAAAAVAAGFRACRRCRPDALPGSRDWDVRSDLAARALRGIAAGVVDTSGVRGLADAVHVSERHLHRVLVEQVGATPVQLARTRRSQLARMLLDQTTLTMADIAFAAGFASIRQFNEVMREQFGAPPSTLRRAPRSSRGEVDDRVPPTGATVTLRLRCTEPFDAASWWDHVAHRAVPGLELAEIDGVDGLTGGAGGANRSVRRVVRAPGGPVEVEITLAADRAPGAVPVRLTLTTLGDLAPTVARLRRWLDLDADPHAIDEALSADGLLAPLVGLRPGLRVAGTVDPFELAVKAVLGQQVSTAGARTLAARLVAAWGEPGLGGLAMFPMPERLAEVGPDGLRTIGLTGGRATTLHHVATAVASGLALRPEADRAEVRAALLALPGIGPWTADYVALRALGDPDVFPAGDLVLRRALGALDGRDPRTVDQAWAAHRASAWQPWRGYGAQHLWSAVAAGDILTPAVRRPTPGPTREETP